MVFSKGFKKIVDLAKYVPGKNKRVKKSFKNNRHVDIYSNNFVARRKAKISDDGVTEGVLQADGINSKYLGKSSIRNSSRPQKYSKPPIEALVQYSMNKELFDEYEVNVEKCVITHGCFNSNVHVLQRQLIPEEPFADHCKYPSVDGLSKYDETVRAVLRKLKTLSGLPTASFNDIFETELSPDKKPGFRFEEEYKMHTKRDALKSAMTLAKKRWNAITNGHNKETDSDQIVRSEIFPGVYTIGARNKKDLTYDEDEVTKSRVVHMPELHCELTSSPWCDFVTQRIKNLGIGSIYIGNNILKWRRLRRDIQDSSFLLEGDWRRFDSTLYINMITMVVSIMRTFFKHDSSYIDKHFIAMYDTIAIKDYYVPGGKVFRAFHGLPSGVKSTALINSIANLLALVYCVGPKNSKYFSFIVGGDDFIISCKSNKYNENDVSEMIFERAKTLGMNLKFLRIKHYNEEKIENCAMFYKYCIFNGAPAVPTSAVLERVFVPWNKDYSTKYKYYKFLKDVQPSLGTPRSHLLLYYMLLKKLTYNISGYKLTFSEIIRSHISHFNKMTDKDSASLFKYKSASFNVINKSVGYYLREKQGYTKHDFSERFLLDLF
jgi:hypothetical protein